MKTLVYLIVIAIAVAGVTQCYRAPSALQQHNAERARALRELSQ